jgi:hypothetical protein
MEQIYKYKCEICNYNTNVKTSWQLHTMSERHNRNGKKKSTKCNICDYESTSHWNIKLHILSKHSTLEERKNHKYYCDICDTVFFCKLYMERHLQGKKHNKLLKNNINLI